MADRRRRRRNSSNTESEHSEGEETAEVKEGKPVKKESECDSEVTQGEDDTSEYDSTTEGYDEEESEEEVTEEIDDDDDDVIVEDGVGDDWIEEERQRGDGEEEPNDGKNLDDDEDKKNPAYIPRKGAFYEHDTRLGDEIKEEKEPLVPKKKLWTDVGKWDHDRFNPDQQGPKSREEIIAIYGYDIRSHEKPPESFPRGAKSQKKRPDRRKQLSDFISPGEEKSYERPYRGRGARGGSWRGAPRGRGWQPSRRTFTEINHDRGGHTYTDFKNARNESSKYSSDIYNADSRARSGAAPGQRQWSGTNQKNSGNKMKAADERPNSSEESLSNPPDVVPAGHAYSSLRVEQSTEETQQSRPRYRQGGHSHVEKTNPMRDPRSKGSQGHVQDSELGKLSKNMQQVSLDEKNRSASVGQNTNSHDAGMLSIYPPVTSHLPVVTAASSNKKARSSPNQGDVEKSSLIPPLTKPHRSTSTTQIKQTDTSQSKAKQVDSTRTKRYSTQRQRPPQEMSGYVQESTREAPITQPAIPTQSAQIVPGQGPICTPLPQYYGQLYARPPAVFRQPNPVNSQSPPHTLSFPQPPVIQPPLQAVPFSIPASSQVQSPPRLHLGPESTVATASITGAVPPSGTQPLLQGPFVPAPVMNYGPPGQQPPPPPPAPSHYQLTGHVPVQFPAPAQGPEPIQIHGGTTYFSHEAPTYRTGTTYFSPEAQQASPSRSAVTRRPKAAIPIINPQDVTSIEQEGTFLSENYMDEQLEFTQDNGTEVYLHDDECYSAGDDQIIEYHEQHSEGVPISAGCDLTGDQDSGYVNNNVVHEAEKVPQTDCTASVGSDPVSPIVPEENTQDDTSNNLQREQEIVIQDDSLDFDKQVKNAAGPNETDPDHSENMAAGSENNCNGHEESPSIIMPTSLETTVCNETDLESDQQQAVGTLNSTEVIERMTCSGDSDTSKTDVSEQQPNTDKNTSVDPLTSQGKETIVTEIKLIYTEAPET